MGGFPLAAGCGSYAEGGARPPPENGSRPGSRDCELNVCPGHPKCLGECRPIVGQDYVRGGFLLATESSRRHADRQRANLLLYLSAGAEPLLPKFQKERKQGAKREPYETAAESKYLRLR